MSACAHPREQVVHVNARPHGYACLACGEFLGRPGDVIAPVFLGFLRAIVAAAKDAASSDTSPPAVIARRAEPDEAIQDPGSPRALAGPRDDEAEGA